MRQFAFILLILLMFVGSARADFGLSYNFQWERTYPCPEGRGNGFNDLYETEGGGLALCGSYRIDGSTYNGWVVFTDADGVMIRQTSLAYGGIGRRRIVDCNTIIQLDDGGFIVGGKTEAAEYSFDVGKIDARGELVWWHNYASRRTRGPACYAVIELKEGDIVAIGEGEIGAFAVRMNTRGEVIWERHYRGNTLYAMREIEDGIVMVGYGPGEAETNFIETDFNGEIVSMKKIQGGVPYTLIRTVDRGFLTTGKADRRLGFFAYSIDDEFRDVWRSIINLNFWESNYPHNAYGVAMNHDGYMIVGDKEQPGGRQSGETFIDLDGNAIWGRSRKPLENGQVIESFKSVIATEDNAFIACGKTNEASFAVKYVPVRHEPYFVEVNPADTIVKALADEDLTFSVYAMDPDGDDISYLWRFANQEVGNDTFLTFQVPEIGEYNISCKISDGEFSDSTEWTLNIMNMYIGEHTPDTLDFAVHRNTEIDFSVEPRSAFQDIYQFSWVMANPLDMEPELISENQQTSYLFTYAGTHLLSANVTQGNFRDNVSWRIRVLSSLDGWYPLSPSFDVALDSTIIFEVVPANPDTLSWQIRWTYDDERIGGRRTQPISFDQLGLHSLTARVVQNDIADTVSWYIMVHEFLGTPESELTPREFSYSLTPNPFNQVSTLNYALPEAGLVQVDLYDSFGRFIRRLEDAPRTSGSHKLAIDGAELSAGVYLVRLHAGDHSAMMKAVLLK